MSMKLLTALLVFTVFGVAAETGTSPSAEGRIYFLDAKGRLLTAGPDGSGLKVLLSSGMSGPDGVAVDPAAGYVYWTNMGKVKEDDGSIQRSRLDGSEVTTLVPKGGTFTAKQMKLDLQHGKMYWSDREGMRVMRANLDGSKVETLVETATGDEARKDARNWCVGIAVDPVGGWVYWTQKGGDNANLGVIRRAPLNVPAGQTPGNRTDIEILASDLPEPIDLDLDPGSNTLYWTDRGDPPNGNSVNRMHLTGKREVEVVVRDLKEGIGLALDIAGIRMFFSDLRGNLYSSALDGSGLHTLLTGQGSLTGVAFVPR